ncbi:hypothetical protein [Mycolicibacterium sp. 120270]|uniref:hypothetical protein n=1 Tax=Mycolicibacterium sp. 120270 TaxID=3090600 RepID=UPI00299DCD3F|nr:hypothetical protein [Mycolicibacterium sp. 120270]MDX1882294.1 hypothetical protein [Mycolicibacterium sp. 120270]
MTAMGEVQAVGVGEQSERRRTTDAWWAVPGALVAAAVFYVAHRGLVDDAYITLSYARNVAEHLHWGMIPAVESNTATSPLNVMMLAVATWLTAVTGELQPVLGLGILTVALSAAMALWAAQIARRVNVSATWSLAVLAVVFANPFVNSALGLEVIPIAAFLTGLTAQAVAGRRIAFGVLAGLLVLTRPDLGIIVAVMYLVTPAMRRRFWVAPLAAFAVALPWWMFSWYHFGSAIPTTLVIKTLQKSFGDATFGNGLWKMWQAGTVLPVLLAVVPAVIGLVAVIGMLVVGARRRLAAEHWPLVGLGLGGLAEFGAYCLLGVPPYHWYYVSSTVALGVTGVFGLALALHRGRVPQIGGAVAVSVALAVGAVVSFAGLGMPWKHPVIFGNWALPQEYIAIGTEVGELVGESIVKAPPEIGTVAFACDCNVVDVFSDPGITVESIEQRIDEAGPVVKWLLELNFSRLDRTQEPLTPAYWLAWSRDGFPPGLPAWHTNSPWTAPATMYLEPVRD